jgi:hypothetical protein
MHQAVVDIVSDPLNFPEKKITKSCGKFTIIFMFWQNGIFLFSHQAFGNSV